LRKSRQRTARETGRPSDGAGFSGSPRQCPRPPGWHSSPAVWTRRSRRASGSAVSPPSSRCRSARWARSSSPILERHEYRPVFQPVRRLADGKIIGYEALTRFDATWTPSQIFAHARLADRLRDLELATLRAAAEASKDLPEGAWLSVNCSADLFVDTEALVGALAPVQHQIVLELSEQDVVSDYRPIADAVDRLGPRFQLAVDDAGAGFSSLRHILEVRPQFVKLDIGLVQGVAADLTRTALVAGFVRFAADAGFDLIAEGIETEADRKALRRLGVRLGQGYLLGKPMSVADIAANPPDAMPMPRRRAS
jgi:EAL domain-containing protein (putative c-di-GMP-specific phosphodiesterase class I)